VFGLGSGAWYHSTNVIAVTVPITPDLGGSFGRYALITVIGKTEI